MACYNWGEDQVLPLVRSLPANPRDRNFWQLLAKYREKIPQETYDYVFYIVVRGGDRRKSAPVRLRLRQPAGAPGEPLTANRRIDMEMDHNPVGRFSSRAADYMRYRPSYPPEIMKWLTEDCGLTANSVVADIGSGTGLLSKVLLDTGCEVFGVEPNPEMRAAGEEFLREYPRFHSVAGRAEETMLPGVASMP